MKHSSPSLSIIIPARQEALRLPTTLQRLQNFLDQHSYTAEIIPVIQGDDKTAEMVRAAAALDPRIHPVFDPTGTGKGRAVRLGVEAARGTIILFMDADLSVPLPCIERLIEKLDNAPHLDLLVASRYLPESRILIPQSFSRRLLGRIFNLLLRLRGLTHFKDTQCGCKLFRKEAAKEIFALTRIEGFAFDVEILLLAQRLGYVTQEAPVEWANVGNSRLGLLRDGMKAFQDVWMLKK